MINKMIIYILGNNINLRKLIWLLIYLKIMEQIILQNLFRILLFNQILILIYKKNRKKEKQKLRIFYTELIL